MKVMNPLTNKDYEIDVWFGKLAAILIIVYGLHLMLRKIAEGRYFWGIIALVFYIFVPSLYLFFLHRHAAKFAKWTLRIWVFWFFLLCLSATDTFLNKPSGFWRVIFPFAVMTACMVIGQMGVSRVKESDPYKVEQMVKIPKRYINTRVLITTIGAIFSVVFTFTFMIFISKYVCDFIIAHWSSFEQNRKLLFYAGVAISYYPSRILAAAIPAVSTVLFGRIWNLCAKHNTDKPSQHNDPPSTN